MTRFGKSINRNGRRLAVVAVSAAVAATCVPGLGVAHAQVLPTIGEAAASLATYTTEISPTGVLVNSTTTFTMTIANPPRPKSLLSMGAIDIAVPAGWSAISVGAPTTTNFAPWSATVSGTTVKLRAKFGVLGSLPPGSGISVPITATAPAATQLKTWAVTAAPLAVGGLLVLPIFTLRNWPSTVQVADTTSNTSSLVDCPANSSCTSNDIFTANTMAQVFADSAPTHDTLAASLGDPISMTCKMGNNDTLDFSVNHRSKTVEYTVTNLTTTGICYSSPKPFLSATGPSAFNPLAGEYQGNLLPCQNTRFTPPCVQSMSQNIYYSASRTFVVLSPVGDPRIGGGGSILKFATPST